MKNALKYSINLVLGLALCVAMGALFVACTSQQSGYPEDALASKEWDVPVFETGQTGVAYAAGQFLIAYDSAYSHEDVLTWLSRQGVNVYSMERLPGGDYTCLYAVVSFAGDQDPAALCNALNQQDFLFYAEPDMLLWTTGEQDSLLDWETADDVAENQQHVVVVVLDCEGENVEAEADGETEGEAEGESESAEGESVEGESAAGTACASDALVAQLSSSTNHVLQASTVRSVSYQKTVTAPAGSTSVSSLLGALNSVAEMVNHRESTASVDLRLVYSPYVLEGESYFYDEAAQPLYDNDVYQATSAAETAAALLVYGADPSRSTQAVATILSNAVSEESSDGGTVFKAFTLGLSSYGRCDFTNAVIEEIEAQNYTSREVTPALTITYQGETLTEGVDYTVTYENNIIPGTASYTATGIGDYYGVQTGEFQISKCALDVAALGFTDKTVEYTGESVADLLDISSQLPSGIKVSYKYYLMPTHETYYTVVIDPGHGGYDGGAARQGIKEKAINLNIALAFAEEMKTYAGVKVYLTRSTDIYLTVKERVVKALAYGADIYVSVHCNTSAATSAHGTEIYVANKSTFNHYTRTIGYELGEAISDELEELGLYQRGVKSSNSDDTEYNYYYYKNGDVSDYLGVVRYARLRGFTGILVEYGFMSNANELTKLASTEDCTAMGKASAAGVASVLGVKKKTGNSKSDTLDVTRSQELSKEDVCGAHTYMVVATFSGSNKYVSYAKKATAYITVTKAKVAVPSNPSDLTYTGEEQIGVYDDPNRNWAVVHEQATENVLGRSVNVATKVGTYKVPIELFDPSNYEWEDSSFDGYLTFNIVAAE